MNEREMLDKVEFERQWAVSGMPADKIRLANAAWHACAESKQSELDKANSEVEYYLSAYRLAHKQAMDNGQARDKANARIAQLEDSLKLLFDEVEYQSKIGGWTDRFEIDVAKAVLSESPSTWLLEHDKAVEVNVLEGIRDLTQERLGVSISDFRAILFAMIDARKLTNKRSYHDLP